MRSVPDRGGGPPPKKMDRGSDMEVKNPSPPPRTYPPKWIKLEKPTETPACRQHCPGNPTITKCSINL